MDASAGSIEANARIARRASPVVVLARFEGRRILSHPAFLGALALATLIGGVSAWISSAPIRGAEYGWRATVVVTTSLLAMATVLAANAAGRRERASGTGELFDATATSRSRRTTAQLLSSAWPSSMTIVVVAAAVVLLAVRGGQHLEVADALRLAQVPLVVAGFSALGTALGRLSPMPAPAIFAATLAFFLPFPADGERPLDWLAPFASWGWSSLPSLGWHAVYLLGGVVAISSLALIVTGARRRAALVLALAIAAGAGAATFQLPVECHDVDLVGKVCTF